MKIFKYILAVAVCSIYGSGYGAAMGPEELQDLRLTQALSTLSEGSRVKIRSLLGHLPQPEDRTVEQMVNAYHGIQDVYLSDIIQMFLGVYVPEFEGMVNEYLRKDAGSDDRSLDITSLPKLPQHIVYRLLEGVHDKSVLLRFVRRVFQIRDDNRGQNATHYNLFSFSLKGSLQQIVASPESISYAWKNLNHGMCSTDFNQYLLHADSEIRWNEIMEKSLKNMQKERKSSLEVIFKDLKKKLEVPFGKLTISFEIEKPKDL